jgi:aminoglycoside phosphotransferase (APT) family kinase protein
MEPGPLIAEGRTAEIYAWGEEHILKLYRPGFSQEMAEYERKCAQASENTGYAVPKVGDLLIFDNRPGIIYQRLSGTSMWQQLQAKPYLTGRLGRQMAEVHADMHTRTASGLPKQRERLIQKIERGEPLEAHTKQKALAILKELPDDGILCHGDFHPDNILMTANGLIIIDWIDASIGHPLADVARTFILGSLSGLPRRQPARIFTQLSRKLLINPYLKRYFQRSPYTREEMEKWLVPVAAARLSERIEEEYEEILRFIDRALNKQM